MRDSRVVTTAAERIMRDRTQPLTPVERAFFSIPDHMVKPHGYDREVGLMLAPAVAERFRRVLVHDSRFNGKYGNGIGHSEFDKGLYPDLIQ